MKKKVRTLIIGSGFSGRTVASYLGKEDLIIERGENRTYFEMLERYLSSKDDSLPFWKNARHAYKSDINFNAVYDISGRQKCFSQFEFIGGGSSNRWDGNAVRAPEYIFSSDKYLRWPISYKEISPYYAAAEDKLNLCGDHSDLNPGTPAISINSGDRYRALFNQLGLNLYIRNQAKNPIQSHGKQNLCLGAGSCEICPMDAKFRPEHLSINVPIQYETLGKEILFKGKRAVALDCQTTSGDMLIEFEEIVIAAHAIESARILYKSAPNSVNISSIGRYFQDHAQCELLVLCPFNFPHYMLPFKASLEIQSLTGNYEGIDVLVTVEATQPELWEDGWVKMLEQHQNTFIGIQETFKRCAGITLTFEIPPKKDSHIDFSGHTPVAHINSWHENVRQYDKILETILDKLKKLGFTVLESRPHFRHIYGQHHLVGTLNMSAGTESVVSRDFRVIGTDNVYVAGTSLIPRLGASNPTLTAIALSMMLGEQLEKQHALNKAR